MWEIGIVFVLSEVTNNSLTLIALCGFCSSLFIALFMPIIGIWLDNEDRLIALKCGLAVKLVSVSLTYLFCLILQFNSSYGNIMFYLIPITYAIANCSFSLITQSVEKDWLIVLSDGDSEWLTQTNSMMSQIDLICGSISPILVGIIFSFVSIYKLALILLFTNTFVVFALLSYMNDLYYTWPMLSVKNLSSSNNIPYDDSHDNSDTNTKCEPFDGSELLKKQQSLKGTMSKYFSISLEDGNTDAIDNNEASNNVCCWCHQWLIIYVKKICFNIKKELNTFMNSGCVCVMISYSFLYFTVLSFSPLMIVYLRWCNLSDFYIGFSRGAANITGIIFLFYIHDTYNYNK
jgi:hypothetical protein